MYEIATIGSLVPCCDSCAAGNLCDSIEGLTEGGELVRSGFFPTGLVFPGDVDAYKARLDPEMRTTEGSVSRCANLSSGDAVAWGDFYTEWRKFADRPTPLVSSWSAELDIAKSYESRLRDWQAKLSPICAMRGPEPSAASSVSWGKIAIGVAVVGVGAALIYSFVKAGQRAHRSAQAGAHYLEEYGRAALPPSRALARR